MFLNFAGMMFVKSSTKFFHFILIQQNTWQSWATLISHLLKLWKSSLKVQV